MFGAQGALVGELKEDLGGRHTQSGDGRSSPPYLALPGLSAQLFLSYILYNKAINVNTECF